MTYKMQQVLRTKAPLTTDGGTALPPKTRVVVMNMVDSKRVRVKIMDPTLPDLRKTRVVATTGSFELTHRGRPRKDAA